MLQEDIAYSDTALAALIDAWVQTAWPGDSVKHTFIRQELESRLTSYRRKARWWRTAQISVWLFITLLGLLISVFAGFKAAHGFTIVAGALVATLTTLTNALHPAKQADGYENARLALRDESWLLLNRRHEYAKLDDDRRYDYFAQAIHDIVQTKRTSTNLGSVAA